MWRLAHVETDSVDREGFERVLAGSAELRRLLDEGERLLPHFRLLLRDLFASLYKLVRVRYPAGEMAPSVRAHALLLDALEGSGALERLRAHSELDVARAGLGTALLAERLLDWLRRSRGFSERELAEGFRAARAEAERADEERAEVEARRLAERAATARGRTALEDEARRRGERRTALERALARAGRDAERAVDEVPRAARRRLERRVAALPEELEQLWDRLESWELDVEGEPRDEALRRIDLGRRLARNPKLEKLAALVGRLREQERGLRRLRTPRRSQEVYAVGAGDDPGRLLPAELVKLRHPLARRDLLRRLLEASAQVYALRGEEARGRGPMVVCLDCSSSMTGEKELWSKALALTLLHVARRRRRALEVIAFSGADAPLVHFPLLAAGGPPPDAARVQELAVHFPGGGTSFEKVLSTAVERARSGRYRGRADLVLISDGESSVSAPFLARLERERRELGVLTVLIDVGPATLDSVRRFSDRVVSVTRLTDESVREIFLELG